MRLPARGRHPRLQPSNGVLVLDLVYLLGIIVLFAAVGLLGRAVEKL